MIVGSNFIMNALSLVFPERHLMAVCVGIEYIVCVGTQGVESTSITKML